MHPHLIYQVVHLRATIMDCSRSTGIHPLVRSGRSPQERIGRRFERCSRYDSVLVQCAGHDSRLQRMLLTSNGASGTHAHARPHDHELSISLRHLDDTSHAYALRRRRLAALLPGPHRRPHSGSSLPLRRHRRERRHLRPPILQHVHAQTPLARQDDLCVARGGVL